MADPLPVALIGAGHIARYHLSAWQKARDARLVAICDIDGDRAAARAAAYGIPRVYTDAARMFQSESLVAVDIATWRDTHADLTLLAAAHGVHVLCQKPLAGSYGQARRLTDDVAGRIRLMVNENRRFAPQYRRMRGWIDEGRLGELRQGLLATYNSSQVLLPDGTRAATRRAAHFGRETRLLIAGALTHHLDVLRYLLGPLDLVAARARRTEDGVPGETVATLLLATAAGACVVLQGNTVAHGFADAPSGRSTGRGLAGDQLDLVGSRATSLWRDDVLRLLGPEPDELRVDVATAYQRCFDAAVEHFVAGLRTGAPFETSARDNLETLALVERAYALAGLA